MHSSAAVVEATTWVGRKESKVYVYIIKVLPNLSVFGKCFYITRHVHVRHVMRVRYVMHVRK